MVRTTTCSTTPEGRSEATDCGVQLVAEGAGREPQGHYKVVGMLHTASLL
jgi:hypothetical protein